MKMLELPDPVSRVLKRIVEGEILLVEFNSFSNVELLPFEFCSIGKTVFIEIGDKLHVKLYALMKALNDSDLLDRLRRTPIISVSNFYVSVPGFNIINIPFNEITKIISKFYSLMRDKSENNLLILSGIEQIALHFDIYGFMREFAGLKVALPSVTFILFVNYDAVERRTLAVLESLSTSVVRLEGRVDFDSGRVRKYVYLVKSIDPASDAIAEIG